MHCNHIRTVKVAKLVFVTGIIVMTAAAVSFRRCSAFSLLNIVMTHTLNAYKQPTKAVPALMNSSHGMLTHVLNASHRHAKVVREKMQRLVRRLPSP